MRAIVPGASGPGPIDDMSKAIIEKLQRDGRRSYAGIGKDVGLSEAAVRQRVQRLIDSGVMDIVAVTDPMQLGFTRQAMVGVRCQGDATNVAERLKTGQKIGGRSYKVHLDGYDLAPMLRARSNDDLKVESPRKEFIYWTDDGSVAALRFDNWKITFLEQQAEGLRVWQEPFVPLRAPKITNLRMDPFERAEDENAMGYQRWYMERMFMIAPAGAFVGKWLQSFREFPPRQKPGSFNLDRVMEEVSRPQKN
jgi:DNA-binding Lrp family transcriptional regulator